MQTALTLFSIVALLLACGAALVFGGARERAAAAIVLVSDVASMAVQRLSRTWDPIWPLTAIDVVVLALFVWLAWRPRRGWQLWAVGVQGLLVAIDGLRAAELGLQTYTYLAAVNLTSAAITAVIAYAAWTAWRRRRAVAVRA